MKDRVGSYAEYMPMWDRGHAFVGGKSSGSSMHMDQALWSNIGKNWAGYKILFVWEFGEPSLKVLNQFNKRIMKPPFTSKEMEALQSTIKVALVGPGDVFVFSGANAHMTLGVGDLVSLTAYESYVNLNPHNVATFRASGRPIHFRDCIMEEDELEDMKDDIVDNIEKTLLNAKQQGFRAHQIHGRSLQHHILEMVKEFCKDKFYRYELRSIKKIRCQIDRILHEIDSHKEDRRRRYDSSNENTELDRAAKKLRQD